MANKRSKKKVREDSSTKTKTTEPSLWARAKKFRTSSPHKAFKRSYRKDYQQKTNLPSIMQHILASFRIIFKNWRLFLPMILVATFLQIVFLGLMSEADYTKLQESAGNSSEGVARAGIVLLSTTRMLGFSSGSAGATIIFQGLIFTIVFLTTIFILRFLLAQKKIKFREALYNSMAPMIPATILLIFVMIECIPILILTVAYAAAVQTEFLTLPFYALLFAGFAGLMLLISGYLLSSTLMAFVAVSAPGMYPLRALNLAAELMRGRRINLVIRLIALIIVVVIMWIVVMLPIIMIDLAVKNLNFATFLPTVPICLMVMISFTSVFVTTYLYLYYRWLLDN